MVNFWTVGNKSEHTSVGIWPKLPTGSSGRNRFQEVGHAYTSKIRTRYLPKKNTLHSANITAKKITHLYSSDAVPTVLLAEWDLHTDYFDGATLSGPVPRLFAAQPDEARTALRSDPAKAFKDLQRIQSRLFIAENIPATEAWSFVGNPRQVNVTELKYLQHFLASKYLEQVNKKVMAGVCQNKTNLRGHIFLK